MQDAVAYAGIMVLTLMFFLLLFVKWLFLWSPIWIPLLFAAYCVEHGVGPVRGARQLRANWYAWRCKRARKYLFKHDGNFRTNAAEMEVVRRRQAFYAAGGSASDPNCPDLFSVLEEWGFDPLKPLPEPKT